jgi:hypothetical protein
MRKCLFLLPFLIVCLCAAAGDAPKKKWEAMDYGPTLGCSLQIDKEYVLRALMVRLSAEKQTYFCYDLETLRPAAAWSGGFIDFNGVIFNGNHHAQPKPKGTFLFQNGIGPGWAKDGSFADPRPEVKAAYNVPPGGSEMTREGQPMPAEWGHFNGYYLNGERVIVAYTIRGVKVLESPSLSANGSAVLRTLTIAPNTEELRAYVAPASAKCSLAAGAAGVELASEGDAQILKIAPAAAARTVVLAIGENPGAVTAESLEGLTHGGELRWKETLTTAGTLGKEDDEYAVDTLTAPEENPWHSWLRFGGFDFFKDGTSAAICTWSGDVWIVRGIDASLKNLTWKRFATGLYQPLGLKIVDDTIYLTCRDQLTRLHDVNGDGEADFYENFNSDIHLTRHFHEFALDLQTDSHGNFYFAKGSTPGRGGPNFDLWSVHNGGYMRVSKDGSKLDVIARGLRAPNGIGVGPNDELVSGDNQGSWVPVCPINQIRPGGFVGIPDGVPGDTKPTKRDDPIVWIPFNVDNSSGDQIWVPDDRWGPFKGQMLHLSYGKCSLFDVMTQPVGDELQGAIAKFPLTFGTGVMRSRFNAADGQLYVCGLKGWQTTATKDGVFQRVRYTGKPVHMPSAFKVTKQGIEITFTCSLDKASAEDVQNYGVEQFNVIWSKNYGTPEMSVSDPTKKGRDPVDVKSAKLLSDGKTVALEIPGIKPVHCMVTKFKIQAADGKPVENMVCNTINAVP